MHFTAGMEFQNVKQTAATVGSYTLEWSVVGNLSSIRVLFQIYNDDELKYSTRETNYMVTDLQPCTQYKAKIEAVCITGWSNITIDAVTGRYRTPYTGIPEKEQQHSFTIYTLLE